MGTWGVASIALIVGGCFLLIDPTVTEGTVSGSVLPGIVLIVAGVLSLGLAQLVTMPLLGLDPPIPIPAKKILPFARLTRWVSAGPLRELPDGTPKEVRVKSRRITLVRMGDRAYALSGLCSHARLPLAGFPGSPIKADPVRDDCIMCPFHGARFEIETGRVVRQPFDSKFNQDHPLLGGLQSKLFKVLSAIPAPPGAPKPSMKAEDLQTYPCKVENGEVMVALPKR
jgi:3-phenylpropionate/trans-cinnamate dioxygenase ferredoxin subunit